MMLRLSLIAMVASCFVSGMSVGPAYKVETTSRLAQWRIENIWSYRRSDPFRIGLWNWFLTVKINQQFSVELYPEVSSWSGERPPVASFIIKLVSFSSDRKIIVHPEIRDKQLKDHGDFVWNVDTPITDNLIIDIEFLDLKITSPSGGEPTSIWTRFPFQKKTNCTMLSALARMLIDNIHTDITIITSDGIIRAHRAVLATRSPVFYSMFSHNLKDKELSIINITDMSLESCQAFLNYIYGNLQLGEFMTHRLDLLRAADKYDIADLKEACCKTLVDDIDTKNVLERLQAAHLYRLDKLKASCMRYLVKFGKVYEIRDELNLFFQNADRELISELFREILSAWNDGIKE